MDPVYLAAHTGAFVLFRPLLPFGLGLNVQGSPFSNTAHLITHLSSQLHAAKLSNQAFIQSSCGVI